MLELYERGGISLAALAERFRISYGFTKKIRQQQLRTGKVERMPQRYGTRRQATEEVPEQLRQMLRQQPDLTLAELREKLQESGVKFSVSGLWRVLERMGLRLKKNAARARARYTRKPAPP